MNAYTNVISYGNTLFCRRINNGKRELEKIVDFHPRIFVPTKTSSQTKFRTITGAPVVEFDAGDIRETRKFIEQNKDVDNFAIYGNIQPEYQYININYTKEIDVNVDEVVVAIFDIEVAKQLDGGYAKVEDANGEIISIAIKYSNIKRKIVFACKEYTNNDPEVLYVKCKSEEDLLRKFTDTFSKNYPDVVSGWNINFFDIPYFVNRSIKLFGDDYPKKLSPWNIIKSSETFYKNRKMLTYDLFGIAILDYMDLYEKFTYTKQESMTLGHIAFVELGEEKVSYTEFDSLQDLYEKDFQKFILYNLKDIELIQNLENKMKLIELAIIMAYDAKINFDDVFSAIRMWDVIIYNHLLKSNVVIPNNKDSNKVSIEGGYVKEPIPGFHEWIVTFDLQSLYPHLIMQYNISPETILNKRLTVDINDLVSKQFDNSYLTDKKITMTANGQLFSTEKQGFLPELMAWMFEQRLAYKKKMKTAEIALEEIEKEMRNRGLL